MISEALKTPNNWELKENPLYKNWIDFKKTFNKAKPKEK